jgi:hypothetical protein
MAPPKVLVLGLPFVRRLKSDLHECPLHLAQVYMHGIGGRTLSKVRNHDLG